MRSIGLLMMSLLLLLLPCAAVAEKPVVVLELEGAIGPASSDYVERAMRDPVARDAQAVIIRIDTPGGLDTAMRDIIRSIIASPIPVVTYVAPGGARAASAGTYILYASHVAAMAPGTNLGAATPVQFGGMPEAPEADDPAEQSDEADKADKPSVQPKTAMERKVINDAVAYIRSLADMRGRNADWAEQAVREGVSLDARQALESNVIDLVVGSMDDLLRELDGRTVEIGRAKVTLATAGAEVVTIAPDWRTRLLGVITNPNVAYILMLIGIYGLIFELANPGGLVPGVLGGICLLLALFAFQALPINYAGLALIMLGLAFIVAEAFVTSFGILGIGGVIAFVIGSVMLFDTEAPAFRLSLQVIGGFAIVSVLLLVGLVTMLLKARRRPVVAGAGGLIGAEGVAISAFSGPGQIRVHGEIWAAVSDRPVMKNQLVRVVAREGLRLRIEPISDSSLSSGES